MRYSESFKQEVVRYLQKTGESQESVRRRFGIGGSSTLPRWIKKYGDPRLQSTKMIIMKADEQDEQKKQNQRIKELEKALVNLQLKHLESEAFLEVACERLGEDKASFKKKADQQALKKR